MEKPSNERILCYSRNIYQQNTPSTPGRVWKVSAFQGVSIPKNGHQIGLFMAGKKMTMKQSIVKFWSKVQKTEQNGCWIWYGKCRVIHVNGKSVPIRRFSFFLSSGVWIRDNNLLVLNTCNNIGICVNPNHLYVGTINDQIRDQIDRGRIGLPKPTEEEYVNRFMSRIIKGRDDECWKWNSKNKRQSYKRFWKNGKSLQVHRILLELKIGRSLRINEYALHTCDNRWCVNPSHLFLGNAIDNVDDMVAKNRQAKGENHGMSKLTSDEVKKIREFYNCGSHNQKELGKMFGVTEENIRFVVNRITWRHVK